MAPIAPMARPGHRAAWFTDIEPDIATLLREL